MKLLFENWRKYLNERDEESLRLIEPGTWSAEDLKQEYGEEVASAHKDDVVSSRWPEIKDLEKYPFLKSGEEGEEAFVEAVQSAPVKSLSLGEIKKIWNHAQAAEVAVMIERGVSTEDITDKMTKFFSQHKTDPGTTSGKTYPKDESYLRWVETFDKEASYKGTQWPPQPPILVVQDDGSYAHVSGHTRQVGALTNKKVLPYIVLSAIEGVTDETPT